MMIEIIYIVTGIVFLVFLISAILMFRELSHRQKHAVKEILENKHIVYKIKIHKVDLDSYEFPQFNLSHNPVTERTVPCRVSHTPTRVYHKNLGEVSNYQFEHV